LTAEGLYKEGDNLTLPVLAKTLDSLLKNGLKTIFIMWNRRTFGRKNLANSRVAIRWQILKFLSSKAPLRLTG